MMKERELERSEVAKITLQADRAETALALVRKESAQAQSDNDKLKTQLEILLQQLEDEKQKVEDLQFQAEEENINKEDFNKYKQNVDEEMVAKLKKISELEAEVSLLSESREAARAAMSAALEKHTTETETLNAQHREELQAAQMLSGELQKLLDEAYALLREKENEKDSIGKSMNEELTKVRLENEKMINEAKSKLSITQTEFEAQLAVFGAKLQAAENNLALEKQVTEKLSKDNAQASENFQSTLTQLQAELQDKTHELNKVVGAAKEYELSSSNDILKLKMELSAKIHDLEMLTDSSKKNEHSVKTLQDELTAVKESSSKKITEYETLLNETSQKNDILSIEIAEMRQKIIAKDSEIEQVLSDKKNSSIHSEKIVEEYKQSISERDKEIVKLKSDLEIANKSFSENQASLLEEHNKEISEKNSKIDQLANVIEEHKKDIETNKLEFETLMAKVESNLDELKALTEQNNKLKASLEDASKVNAQLSERISTMELECGDLKRQLQNNDEKYAELKKLKEKLEADILNLTSHSSDSSEQLNKLTQNVQEKENELQVLRDAHRDKINQYERIEQELKQQLEKVKQDSSAEKANIVQQLIEAQHDVKQHQEKIIQLNGQITQVHEVSAKNVTELQNSLEAERENVEIQVESYKALEIRLQTQMQTVQSEAEKTIKELNSRIEIMKEDGQTSEVKLKEKVDQLVEAQNDLNNKLEIARNNEEHLQKSMLEVTTKLNNEKLELDAQLKQRDIELTELKEVVDRSVAEISKLTSSTEEKDVSTREITLKYALLEADLKAKADVLLEKERQISVSDQEIARLLEQSQNLESQLKSTMSENINFQQRLDALSQDKSGNDSLLKEQQQQVESFRKTLEANVEENNKLNLTIKEKTEEFNKLHTEHSTLMAQVEERNKQVTDLKETLKSKDELLNAEMEKVKENNQVIENYAKLLSKTTEEIQEKDKLISNFTQEVEKLKKSSTVNSEETSEKIESFKKEIETLKTSHKIESEILKKNVQELENTNKDLIKTVAQLSEAKEKVTELQAVLAKAEADIKQLNSINDGQKSNYEDLNQQLKLEFDKYKRESKTKRHGLMERLQTSEKILGETKTTVKAEQTKQKDLQEKLAASEKTVIELSNKVELLTLHQENSKSEQVGMLEKVTLELQAARKAQAETAAANQELSSKLNLETENKTNEIFKQKNIIAQLHEDIMNLKAKVEIAEREKVLMQKEKSSLTSNGNAADNNNITDIKNGDDDKLKLLEEKEIVEGQVDFLNSVIVDMQRKNEQLLARVQALETGFLPQEVDEFNFNGVKTGKPAPRLFCDICDVFDAHDTEDCPRQAASDPPPPAHARKPPPAPRPYCDVCEAFGHNTENCVEEETY